MRKLRIYILIITLICDFVLVFALPQMIGGFTGRFNLASGPYLIVSAVSFALACLAYCLFTLQKGLKFKNMLKSSGVSVAAAVIALLAGMLVNKAVASAQSSLVKGICSFGMVVMTTLAVMMLYFKKRASVAKKAQAAAIRRSAAGAAVTRFTLTSLFGAYQASIAAALVFLIIGVDYQFIVFTAIYTSAALLLWKLTSWRGWMLFAFAASLIHSLCYCSTGFAGDAMTNLSVYLPISVLVTILLLPVADLYTRREEAL